MAFLWICTSFLPNSANAQEGKCGTVIPVIDQTNLPIQCKLPSNVLDDTDNLPYYTVKVNIHWVTNKKGENFTPNNPIEELDGNKAARDLILWANYNLRDFKMHPNLLYPASQSFLHDSHIRYELYSEPNKGDTHGGIWYWDKNFKDQDIDSYPYKNNVINIVMHDNYSGQGNGSGQAFPGSKDLIYIYRVFEQVKAKPIKLWDQKQIINHEFGHICSLEHSFEANPCGGVDIDVVKECNYQPAKDDCNNWDSGSSNMMGYNPNAYSLSPCQWKQMYSFLMNSANKKWLKIDCNTLKEDADIVLDNHKETVWDNTKMHNGNITVKTGSQLTIKCLLRLGPNKKITVERGAELLVIGGTITKLCDEAWRGIFVHGNPTKEQPLADINIQYTSLAADGAGVVVFKGGSKISWARTVVSTNDWDLPEDERPEIWGGLVIAEKTTFLNNRRVGEFMQYKDFLNKSYFNNCSFEKDTDVKIVPSVLGVTIWDTQGITFENNNTFNENFDRHIFGIDCSPIINGNVFYSNANVNILTESTLAYYTDAKIINNDFYPSGGGGTAIISYSGNDAQKGFEISGNRFGGAVSKGRYQHGIIINGSTEAFIFGNSFKNACYVYNMEIGNTGADPQSSIIKCNTFDDQLNSSIGIRLYGNNKNTLLVGNNFNKGVLFSGTNITLASSNTSDGQIKNLQKWANIVPKNPSSPNLPNDVVWYIDNNPQLSASNIFNDTQSSQKFITTNGTVKSFLYKTPEDFVAKIYGVEYYPEPVNNNYDIDDFKKKPTECSPTGTFGDGGGNEPPFSNCNEHDIEVIRTQINTHQQQNSEVGAIDIKTSDLQSHLIEVIRCVVHGLLSDGRSEAAENLFLAQPEPEYRRFAYGLKVTREDYEGALQVLHTLPTETNDNKWYREIQEINIRRFKAGGLTYKLTASEESFLTEAANSQSKERGYARALLDLLKGYRDYPNDNYGSGSQYRSMKEYTTATLKANERKDLVFINPNPILEDNFQVNTKDINITNGLIQFRDIMGNIALEQKFTALPFEKRFIDCASLRAGLYAVQIFDGNLVVFEGKISVLR